MVNSTNYEIPYYVAALDLFIASFPLSSKIISFSQATSVCSPLKVRTNFQIYAW